MNLWRAVAAGSLLATGLFLLSRAGSTLTVSSDFDRLPADGMSTLRLTIRPPFWTLHRSLDVQVVEGRERLRFESLETSGRTSVATLRAGVTGGTATVEVRAEGQSTVRVPIELDWNHEDLDADGMPDVLRLGHEDANAFRSWFAYLAELQFFTSPDQLPSEVADCAGLVRFAYYGALRRHDREWMHRTLRQGPPDIAEIRRFNFPDTPLGPTVFRVKPGPYAPDDVPSGAFAWFADAETLMTLNMHAVSRRHGDAQPGDLFAFRQGQQRFPFHLMVVVGRSRVDDNGESHVVYHTGPDGGSAGEIRRPSIRDLERHPDPRWRPEPSNPNFLGVFRWNILRGFSS